MNTFGWFSTLRNDNIYLARPGSVPGLNMSVHVNRLTLDGITPWADTGVTAWQVDAEIPTGSILPHISSNGIVAWRDVGDESNWYDERGVLAQRVDTLGNVLWSEEVLVCSTNGHEPRIVSTHDKGGITIWQDTRNGNIDLYSTRIDSLGNLPPGIVEDQPQIVPIQLEVVGGSVCLNQAELRFSLPHEVEASLTVYDASGRRIKELPIVDGQKSIWDGYNSNHSLCPTGVYFVRLDAPNLNSSAGAKIVLLH